jgi:hypothetical protein
LAKHMVPLQLADEKGKRNGLFPTYFLTFQIHYTIYPPSDCAHQQTVAEHYALCNTTFAWGSKDVGSGE